MAPTRPKGRSLDRCVADGSAELVFRPTPCSLRHPTGRLTATVLLKGGGLLWRIDLAPEVKLKRVPIDELPPINNDHVIDAERGVIYLSANDCHIYSQIAVDDR
jgi:TolB protein